ncbi:MAG TPA: ABC transporter permease [Tepidisphaeraceae bacterium]|nr:ABC transporter permease [Tepidisphaeraceae bacterium]
MNLYEVVRVALLDLALHKFRSALATIGIIFGVASVMAMISISEGAKRETLGRIARLGVDNIIVKSVKPSATDEGANQNEQRRWQAEYGLLRRDLEHVRQTFKEIRHVVGIRNMRMNLYARNGRQLDLAVIATEPDYLLITRSGMTRGRFLSELDQDNFAKVCVVGSDAARKLFIYDDPINQGVRIKGDWYNVIGILDNSAAVKDAGGDDINNQVFIPLRTARARYGDVSSQAQSGSFENVKIQLDQIAMQLTDSELVQATATRMENYLAATHKRKDYTLLVPLELMRQKVATQRIFTIVMASIASISLLIGGIGIMNIMLANVYDRRKEIGMRRALGARRKDIQRQFVFEAATLTSLGGLVGVALGYAGAWGVSTYAEWPTSVTPISIALSLGVSCITGVVFGLWPARQAARVNPIEALRAD